ncbi:MAG: DUF1772 domain-containing protein [Novosphingobium sp.]|nr:DUF1772 domain-containing protein [Novosphingobium sp.]MCP5404282.1 DUF1772 domain-containing protein [Novosphingobium sp.]
MDLFVTVLLWFMAVSSGLMAGIYFAFSVFVMRALATLERGEAIRAMNAINAVIVRTAFLPLFFASSLGALALAVIGGLHWGVSGGTTMAQGGAAYFVGMFMVTVGRNVPLNNALAAVDPASDTGAAVWAQYLRQWTRWNHVRTIACTVSLALFIAAIASMRA